MKKNKLRSIHEVMEDETSSAILAQISMHGGNITANQIAKNINTPLSTIYDHLKTLEMEGFILAKEERFKNLIKKTWFRTDKPINLQEKLTKNLIHNKSVPSDPLSASSRVKYLNATLKEKLLILKQIDQEKFTHYQTNSSSPFNVLQLFITKNDYEFAMEKIFELHDELKKRNAESMNYKRTSSTVEEKFLFFYLALPDLEEIK
jgi:DNA-binding transcriptional ArsR family regulator